MNSNFGFPCSDSYTSLTERLCISSRAYITNISSKNISICTVSGDQLTCGQQVHLNSSSVGGIALSPDGQTAYIVNPRSNSVTVCSILADNTLKCGDPTGSNMANPLGIAISPDGTKAYVTNYNNSGYLYTVTVCSISGFDFTCSKPTGSNLTLPWGIALSPDGSKAYVANEASTPLGAVTVCQVLGDILTNCQLTAFQNPSASLVGIAISPDGSTAYFSNSHNNTITICNVSDYTFDCGPQLNPNSTTFNNPRFISLSRDGLQLFVTNSRSNKVSVCSVSGQELGPCNNTRSNTYLPEGIAVY